MPDLGPLLWRRFTWRHWRRSPRTTGVLLLVLALGVGVFLSVRLANRAAVAGFAFFTESVTGESDFILMPRGGELGEEVLPDIRRAVEPFGVGLFPVLEGVAIGADRHYTLVGVDLLAMQNALYLQAESDSEPVEEDLAGSVAWDLLGASTQVVVSSALGLEAGDVLDVFVGAEPVRLRVALVAPELEFAPPRPANLLVMDLPGLQALLGRTGRIDRVEVRLAEGAYTELHRDRIAESLADSEDPAFPRWTVETPASRKQTGATMTGAFRFNLSILSGLALLVGIYLVLQALEAAVVRRREEIAVLRSLGVRPAEIRRAWLVESLVLGLAGSALGILLGWAGAQLAVRAIGRTVNALYYSQTAAAAGLDFSECLLALSLGTGASLLAGWLPARDAANTPPAQVLGRGQRAEGLALLRHPWLGILLVVLGIAAWHLPPWEASPGLRLPLAGYAAALLWVVGAGILAGPLFGLAGAALRIPGRRDPALRYAASHLARPSGRHRLTVAGLLVAVGMASGMGILINSFDHTMRGWIGNLLQADLYVSARGMRNLTTLSKLRPETWKALVADPAVAEAEVAQRFEIRIGGLPTIVAGAHLTEASREWMQWVVRPPPGPLFLAGPERVTGVASESFSRRFGVEVGDRVDLPTPAGLQAVELVGVFADYGNERGSLVADGDWVAGVFGDDRAHSVSVTLHPGEHADAVARRWAVRYPGLDIRTQRGLHAEILEVFHQTFSITYALKGLGISVAVIGLALALVSLLLERRRELSTLRRLGMTRRGIARAAAWEGTGIAGVGLVAGLPLSVALGALLIFVINRQSFGWTLAFRVPWIQMVWLAFGLLVVSWFASWSIGYWGSGLPSEQEE